MALNASEEMSWFDETTRAVSWNAAMAASATTGNRRRANTSHAATAISMGIRW
jgi:hypothetical protein